MGLRSPKKKKKTRRVQNTERSVLKSSRGGDEQVRPLFPQVDTKLQVEGLGKKKITRERTTACTIK